MTQAYYSCRYDGKDCDKAIPKFDDKGYLIPESNEKIKEKYGNMVAPFVLNESWDVCDDCKRNYCIGGCCYGRLKIRD